jgi:hypothetical protein
VLVAALVATSAGAAADDAGDLAGAEREYQAGFRALESGDCHTALHHYQRSYELAARPRTLFNMAVCQEQIGQGGVAWHSYQEFLRTAEPRDAAIVPRARTRLDTLRTQLRGRAFIDSTPSGALVYLNEESAPRGTTPLVLSIAPGAHRRRIIAAGGAAAVERTLEVVPDGVATVSIEVAAPVSCPPIDAERTVATPRPDPTLAMRPIAGGTTEPRVEDRPLTEELPRRQSRAVVWGLTGAGGAAMTDGGVLGVLALRDVTSPIADERDRGKMRALVADGLLVTGAVALFVAWRSAR